MAEQTVNKFTLDNGLRVLHKEDKATSLVWVNTLYKVGSCDENVEKTGFAHLFEHLMFGGTPAEPNYDEPIQLAGGENNAFTVVDYTNYYVEIPACNVETAFYMEADRMKGLLFSPKSLEVQRHVVCEEFKERCINQPYGDMQHLKTRAIFGLNHPYGWPTIGLKLKHIEDATLEDVKSFFYSHYAPNNAILSVVGNISLDDTKRLVEKYYGAIPRRQIAVRNIPPVPVQTEPKYVEVERDVPFSFFSRAYHIGGMRTPDRVLADFVTDILANGKSSRVTQRLVREKKLFTSANSFFSSKLEAGVLYFEGAFAEGTTPALADEAFDELIYELQHEKISEYETQKMRNKFEVGFVKNSFSRTDTASDLAIFEMLGDANDFYRQIEAYNKVTPEDAMSFSQRVFKDSNKTTLFYKSKK